MNRPVNEDVLTAGTVHGLLGKHMLADGLPLVLDLERSHGSHIHDARTGDVFLDLFGSYATSPLGFNHPGLRDKGFLEAHRGRPAEAIADLETYLHLAPRAPDVDSVKGRVVWLRRKLSEAN